MKEKDKDLRLMYLRQEVLSASREKLLLLTYEIAINACKRAMSCIDGADAEEANKELKTAQRAVRELHLSLRPEKAEEVAEGLGRLYDFMYVELVEANMEKDKDKIGQVVTLLEELLAAWREALENLRKEGNLSAEEKRKFAPPELVGGGLNISC